MQHPGQEQEGGGRADKRVNSERALKEACMCSQTVISLKRPCICVCCLQPYQTVVFCLTTLASTLPGCGRAGSRMCVLSSNAATISTQ